MKTGPNERCPCGSGKKYKRCCQPKDLVAAKSTEVAQVSSAPEARRMRSIPSRDLVESLGFTPGVVVAAASVKGPFVPLHGLPAYGAAKLAEDPRLPHWKTARHVTVSEVYWRMVTVSAGC